MASYQPKLDSLRLLRAVWRVEEAPMDHLDEAYYLGGDFDGRNDCRFYYMVWRDVDLGRWFSGRSPFGEVDAPFSRTRCTPLGGYATLREALTVCEEHAARAARHIQPALALAV